MLQLLNLEPRVPRRLNRANKQKKCRDGDGEGAEFEHLSCNQ
jgi:hypothetical protein